jgi:tetratricopeptide (TPR) repeat protein
MRTAPSGAVRFCERIAVSATMAQPQNPKIEELRFRLKTDPKSRLFYPLAEELRKVGAFDDGERVLRTGLEHHPTYLSAWVSLGRVLRDQHKNEGAAEALKKALQLDPGNVVAARLLADAYLALGDKVEAIKKYKLVHALLPSDQDLEALIERLDREVNPPFPTPVEEPPSPVEEETPFAPPAAPMEDTKPAPSVVEHQATMETPFADAESAFAEEQREEIAAGDAEPMSAAHDESPFEQTGNYTAAAMTVEEPAGFHVEVAPLPAEVPAVIEEESPFAEPEPEPEPEPAADVFEPAEPVRAADDVTSTITMGDLYARQGLVDDARQIYETILEREPDNEGVRAKLDTLTGRPGFSPAAGLKPGLPSPHAAKVTKLQNWLTKVRNV